MIKYLINYFKCSKWIPITIYSVGHQRTILMGRVQLRTGLYQFKCIVMTKYTTNSNILNTYNANDQLQKLEWAGIEEICLPGDHRAPIPDVQDIHV